MNKEYKLLKKYPSLAKDWEIGMKVGLGDRNYGYSPCAGNYSDCRKLDNTEVENNSEYWELVVEKDYEILSFTNDTDIFTKQSNDVFKSQSDRNDYGFKEGWRTEEHILTIATHCKIHSIKRLSDNEVFTLKDRTKEGVILEFDTPGTNKTECRYRVDDSGRGWRMIKDAKKVKKPLLVTEDGVEMFDGDVVFCLHRNGDGNLSGAIAGNVSVSKYPFDKSVLCFSTLFAAEKHLEENQKRYSLNDLVKVANHYAYIKNITAEKVIKNCLSNGK